MNISKVTFLIAMICYCVAMIVFIDVPYNVASTGLISKVYLFKTLFDAGIAGIAVMKIYENASGVDFRLYMTTDEGQLDLPIYHVPNLWFYGVMAGYTIIMLLEAIDANTNSTGFEAAWFLLWAVADFCLAGACIFQVSIAWKIKQRQRLVSKGKVTS